ncbi:hypothetical protein CsSME_00013206 [Camellia sinensis var. sinensis]
MKLTWYEVCYIYYKVFPVLYFFGTTSDRIFMPKVGYMLLIFRRQVFMSFLINLCMLQHV